MYTQADLEKSKRGMKKEIWINALIVAACAAVFAAGLAIRLLPVAIVGCVLMLCLGYGYFTLKAMPWISYYRFVRDLLNGRSRETEAKFVSVSSDTRTADGVLIHDFVATTGESKDDELLFFWDDDKPIPAFENGQKLKITSYGRFIRAVAAVS